jgi:hypothetical protein
MRLRQVGQRGEGGAGGVQGEAQGGSEVLYRCGIVDLDVKAASKIPHYLQQDADIVATYLASTPQPYLAATPPPP